MSDEIIEIGGIRRATRRWLTSGQALCGQELLA
jgi:hypothetical protein